MTEASHEVYDGEPDEVKREVDGVQDNVDEEDE